MNQKSYFSEIEETFVRRREKNLFLNALDWQLMETWQQRNIPLHIVIRTIENVFDSHLSKNSSPQINSLRYCAAAVDEEYANWMISQVGKSETDGTNECVTNVTQITEHTENAIEALRQVKRVSMADAVKISIDRLKDVAANLSSDTEAVDKSLGDIEYSLNRALLSSWQNDKDLPAIRLKITEQLKTYRDGMDNEAYQQTFDLMLMKALREKTGIPRIGLFYL